METLLKNCRIYDGSGAEPFYGDVRFDTENILEIGQNLTSSGMVIDVEGLAAAPGFIDQHTHTDRTIFEFPTSTSKITQGITSEITGNCGIGSFPVTPACQEDIRRYIDTQYSSDEVYPFTWTDFHGFARAVDEVHPAVNILPLVAHGALRMTVMGTAGRKATAEEIDLMKQLLAENLMQGAWGMSTGLIYPPGSFADTEELVELGRVVADCHSVFTSHVRGESGTLLEADKEIIDIGRRTGCTAVISHLKAIGKKYWGDGCRALKLIEEARSEGLDVWTDQYPYEATNTGLSVLAPDWAHDGGITALIGRLQDPSVRPRLLSEMRERMEIRGGADCVLISTVHSEEGKKYLGKTLDIIAKEEGKLPEEAAADILVEENGAVSASYFSLGKIDVETIIQNPDVAVCSDAFAVDASRTVQNVHPRAYGSFTRVLGVYVREKKLLPLSRAIWKMTGLPAKIFRIPRRGLLRIGCAPDITVFDPDTVCDKATYAAPHQYSEGIEYVFVNGVLSVKSEKLTGDTAGCTLKRL